MVLIITDILGREIETRELQDTSMNNSFGKDNTVGTYLIRGIGDEGIIHLKVVKE